MSSGDECTDHMYQWIKECATDPEHLHDTPAIVWQDCFTHFTEEVGPTFMTWIEHKCEILYVMLVEQLLEVTPHLILKDS